MKPIYEPRGAAKEYGDLALNIYTGCPHRCSYCFAPSVLHREREAFHTNVQPREGIIEATRRQLEKEQITGKTIHLCFTCDPYPTSLDSTATREIIKLLKERGNHVQILTKGSGLRDFDLLDGDDWYGVTISCDNSSVVEPWAEPILKRLIDLKSAHKMGIKTWVSFEPVISDDEVLEIIRDWHSIFDKVKNGKLNYHSSAINWKNFGHEAERLYQMLGLNYYIVSAQRHPVYAIEARGTYERMVFQDNYK